MSAKVFTFVFDTGTMKRSGMMHRIYDFEEDLERQLFWREKIAEVIGFEKGKNEITITVQKKKHFSKAVEIIEKSIRQHLSELIVLNKNGRYDFASPPEYDDFEGRLS